MEGVGAEQAVLKSVSLLHAFPHYIPSEEIAIECAHFLLHSILPRYACGDPVVIF